MRGGCFWWKLMQHFSNWCHPLFQLVPPTYFRRP
jgi:hypothetical protein